MTPRIITLDKRNWLLGMDWRAYESEPSKGELLDDAEHLKADWVCVRVGMSAIQGGFCAALPDVKKPSKLFSLAAYLADSQQQPWMGIFKIAPDLWWYIAVRDKHSILPNGGDVVGGEQEIVALRESHAGLGKWEEFREGNLDDLARLIKEVNQKPTRIRQLHGSGIMPSSGIALGATAALMTVAAAGYWWYDQKVEAQRLHDRQRSEQALALIASKNAQMVPPSPLLSTPLPNDWLASCGAIISELELSDRGWSLEQVSCRGMAVHIGWKAQPGATVADRPEGVVSDDGRAIANTIPLQGLPAAGPDDGVLRSDAALALRAWAQSANFNLNFKRAGGEPAALPGSSSAPTATQAHPSIDFTLNVPISPFELDFSSLRGLRLKSIQANDAGWLIEGAIYGR